MAARRRHARRSSRAPGEGTEVELALPEAARRRDARRVVLVDDHELFRAGVRGELGDDGRDRRRGRERRRGGAADHASSIPTSCCSTSTSPTAAARRSIARRRAGAARREVPRAVGLGRGRGRDRRHPRRRARLRDEDDLRRRAGRRDRAGRRRRRRVLAAPRRLRARRVPAGERVGGDAELDAAHAARARGAAADRARLPLQGDRRAAASLGQDRRERTSRASCASSSSQPARAHPLGGASAA